MQQERRRHVVYLTRNTEYHCSLAQCVAVRDRRTGGWSRDHAALRSRLVGAVDHQRKVLASPEVGSRLFFEGQRPVLTSNVVVVGRPDKSAVDSYCSLSWSGEIDPR